MIPVRWRSHALSYILQNPTQPVHHYLDAWLALFAILFALEGIERPRDYLLTDRRDDALKQFCRQLLDFSLGREAQLSDEPLLGEMQHRHRHSRAGGNPTEA